MGEMISYGPILSPEERGIFGIHPSVLEEAAARSLDSAYPEVDGLP
jgi:hypothetical protein